MQSELPNKAGQANAPVRVGIAGLGRSGWNIHAETMARLSDRFTVAAVTDSSQQRLDEAKARFHCAVYPSVDTLMTDSSVEMIVVATPNHLHAEHSIAAMKSGKHVLCEKPFALSAHEADQVITVAHDTQKVLTIFQNRRFDPHFRKVREIVDSGVLGRIVQVRFTFHNFSRRWDWQTLKSFGGGSLNNTASHFLDQLLSFFPEITPEVYGFLDRALTLGDAEDHCVLMLRGKNSPLVQLEVSSACAFPQDNWLIMGTRGGLSGTLEHLRWRVAQFDQLPKRTLEREPMPDRSYNSEKVPYQEFSWHAPAEQIGGGYINRRYYESLYETLRNGAPLVVTPQQVTKQMMVMDACRRMNP